MSGGVSTPEFVACCITCMDDSGYIDREGAQDWIDELHPDGTSCGTYIADEGETVILDGTQCGDFMVGDWIGSSTDDTVLKIDHFEFYAGFGFMGCAPDGEPAIYLDTCSKVEPADDDEEVS